MSKKKTVMSHDPLEGLADDADNVGRTPPGADIAAAAEPMQAVDQSSTGALEPSTTDDDGGVPSEDVRVIALEANFTIAETAALQEQLLAQLGSPIPCRIDASQVESIDTAGLQLIAAAYKTAAEKGLDLTVDNPSERFVDAARQIGMGGLFGMQPATVSA